MTAATDTRLEKLLRVCEAAGKTVVSARIEGSKIELTFEGARQPAEPDLIDWRPKRR